MSLAVGEVLHQPRRHLLDAVDQVAVAAVQDDVLGALAVVGQHRHALGVGLEDDVAEGVELRGEHEQVEAGVKLVHALAADPAEEHGFRQRRAQLLLRRARAGDDDLQVGNRFARLAVDPRQLEHAFLLADAARVEQHWRGGGRARDQLGLAHRHHVLRRRLGVMRGEEHLLLWQAHGVAGEPGAVVGVEHEHAVELVIQGAQHAADAVALVRVQVGGVLDEVHPVRVHEEERRHVEHVLQEQRHQHHRPLGGTDHAVVAAAVEGAGDLQQVRDAEFLLAQLGEAELRQRPHHLQVRLGVRVRVADQEIDGVVLALDLGELAGERVGHSVLVAQRVGQVQRAPRVMAVADVPGEGVEELAVLVQHAGAGHLGTGEHRGHHRREHQVVEQLAHPVAAAAARRRVGDQRRDLHRHLEVAGQRLGGEVARQHVVEPRRGTLHAAHDQLVEAGEQLVHRLADDGAEALRRALAGLGDLLQLGHAETVVAGDGPADLPVRPLAVDGVVHGGDEQLRLLVLLHLHQAVGDGEAGDLVLQLAAVEGHAQQARVLDAGGDLGEVVEQGDGQLLVLADVAERRDVAGTDRFQRQLRQRRGEAALRQVRHPQVGAALAGEHPQMAIGAAGEHLGLAGRDAEVGRIELVLEGIALDLFLVQAARPVQAEDALPHVALAVEYLETLEQHRQLLEQLRADAGVAGVEVQRVRHDDRDVVLGGVAQELVDVLALAVEDLLLLRREAVGEHVDVEVVFLEEAGELGAHHHVLALVQQLPAGARVVVVGDGDHVAAVGVQHLHQLAGLEPGLRQPQDATP